MRCDHLKRVDARNAFRTAPMIRPLRWSIIAVARFTCVLGAAVAFEGEPARALVV
jgi:hypothetical protein